MKKDEAEILGAMVYGDTVNLSEQIKTDFKLLGTSHLLSVSGTHITSFMMLINLLLGESKYKYKKRMVVRNKNGGRNRKKKENIKGFIQIASIFIYMLFTGFSISVLRAGLMLIISIICNRFKIKKNKYKILFFVLAIIIIHNPYALFNTGLILSFLATLGIFMFYGPIFKVCDKLINKIKQDKVKKFASYLIQNIAITISAQLMIIPVQIQSFNQIPFPLFTSNLILGTISLPIRLFGMLGIMTLFTPCVAKIFFELTNIFIQILIFAVSILKKVSYGFGGATLPMIFIVIYYIVIFLLFVYFRLKDVNKDIKTHNLTRVLYWLKHAIITLIVLVIILVVTFNVYSIYFSKHVYFFNVEQGEMSNIKYGKTNIIIDIGSMKERLAFNTIFNYYKRNNISSIDAVIISHLHKDHINGLEQLLKTFNVDMVICSVPKTISDTYIDFKNMLSKYNVILKEVKKGDRIIIGKVKIEILLPGEEYIKQDEINANSLVCKITAGDTKILYMGDANKEAEQKLITQNKNLTNIDILKVGHHGSKSATSNEFIYKIKPKYAVISALKRYYNHPHEDTLNVLKENNVYTYITEKYGAVKFAL